MKGALAACRARGVEVFYQTPVTGFERSGDRIEAIICDQHRMATDLAVICAGAHSTDLANMAGVELDAEPFHLEAMATEPLRPVITPALALINRLTYLHQTARGEIAVTGFGSERIITMSGSLSRIGGATPDLPSCTYLQEGAIHAAVYRACRGRETNERFDMGVGSNSSVRSP